MYRFLASLIFLFSCTVGCIHARESSSSESRNREIDITLERLSQFKKESGTLSPERQDSSFEDLLDSEAKRLRVFTPEILTELGNRLRSKTPVESEIERLLAKESRTEEEDLRVSSLLDEKHSEEQIPRCRLAFLVGRVGRETPPEVVRILLSAVPQPERDQDLCIMHTLMRCGPACYESLIENIRTETIATRAWVAGMAILGEAQDTAFPEQAGLGSQENWERNFPTSLEELKRLVEEWGKWWAANSRNCQWNASTGLLDCSP